MPFNSLSFLVLYRLIHTTLSKSNPEKHSTTACAQQTHQNSHPRPLILDLSLLTSHSRPLTLEADTMAAVLSGAEIAKHKSPDSCWIVIHSKVYDVTKFLNDHPGGRSILLRQGGAVSDPSIVPPRACCGR